MTTLFHLQVLTMWAVHIPLRYIFHSIQTKTNWVDSSVMTSEVHLVELRKYHLRKAMRKSQVKYEETFSCITDNCLSKWVLFLFRLAV